MLPTITNRARLLGTGLAVLGIGMSGVAIAAPAASALPCRTCAAPPPPPPPPSPRPTLSLGLARQTPDRDSVHVVGYADQTNLATSPVTVEVSIDGGATSTFQANVSRPDVGATHPGWGPDHGFDVTVPASKSPKTVCVTAVGRGGYVNQTLCESIDDVVSFAATGVQYDTADTQITSSSLDELDTETEINNSTVLQSTTISGQKTLTDTSGWTDTYGVQVTVTGGVGIPLITNGSIAVQGSASWSQNGSTAEADQFTWIQPISVPPDSEVKATVAVTRSTLVVPYTMPGNAVYQSGATAPYNVSGTYTGVNSHDLQVTVTQYDLDGSPAVAPAHQPAAQLSSNRLS